MPDFFLGALIASGISAVTSAIGSIFTSSSNAKIAKDTNAANLAIARENNANTMMMFDKTQDFNQSMFEQTNAYNDPSAVRARLIRAGINPAALSSANLASSVSSNQSPTLDSPTMQPYKVTSPLEHIGGSLSDFAQNAIALNQLKGLQSDNAVKSVDAQFALTSKMQSLKREMGQIINSELDAREKRIRLSVLKRQLDQITELNDKNIALANANYDNALKTGREIDSRVSLLDAQTAEQIAATGRLDRESAQRIVSMKNEDWARALVAKSSSRLNESQSHKAYQEYLDLLNTNLDRVDEAHYRQESAKFNAEQKRLLAAALSVQLERERTMSRSEIRTFINRVLGVDVQDALNTAARFIGMGN